MRYLNLWLRASLKALITIGHPVLIPLMVCGFFSVLGQSGFSEIKNARNKSLADQGVNLNDIDGYPYNSSSLANLKYPAIRLSSENRFSGTGIKGGGLTAVIPTGSRGAFGASLEYFGLPEYKRQLIRLGYGRALSERLCIGASFDLLTYHIPQYSSSSLFTLDVGVLYTLSDEFTIGWSSFNPLRWAQNFDSGTSTHLLGCRYTMSKWVSLYVEFEKENRLNWVSKFAVEYWMMPRFSVRIGVNTDAFKINAGFGLELNQRLNFDIACSLHTALGVSPALSLRYSFVPQKEIKENL